MSYNWLVANALALSIVASGAASAQDADQIAQGEKVFRRCAACHQVGEGAQNRVGPELGDVIGRPPGAVEGFDYSDAMIEYGEAGNVWDDETLHLYLENPKTAVPGNKMAFPGLKKPEDRDSVIAYIKANQVTD